MVFSRAQAESFADIFPNGLEDFFQNNLPVHLNIDGYYFFERGRDNFCSNCHNIIHAHGHLVPQQNGMKFTFDDFGPQYVFNSLSSALSQIPNNTRYLLWGQVGGKFSAIFPLVGFPKYGVRKAIALSH